MDELFPIPSFSPQSQKEEAPWEGSRLDKHLIVSFDLLICLFQTVRVWDVSTGSCLSSFNIGQSSASTVTTVSYDQVRDLEEFVRIVTRN